MLKSISCILCILFFFNANTQPLSKKEIESAVKVMAKLINDNYVFPEKGKAIARYLEAEHKKGVYDQVKSWKEFESLSSKTISEFSKDGHMYVRYDPKKVKELQTIKVEAEPETFSEDPFYYGPDALENNFGFEEVKIETGNIGYIKLTSINISERSLPVLSAAMEFVSNTKGLIIDVRNNGGGGSAIGSVFESFFLPKETPLLEFKSRNVQPVLTKTVAWLTQKKYDKPLFILINKGTFSAAEAFAYSLQAVKRAQLVGQTSGGGAHMNSWYPVNEDIFISISTAAPTLPGTEQSWEGRGVQPNYFVEEGKEIEYVKQLLTKIDQ